MRKYDAYMMLKRLRRLVIPAIFLALCTAANAQENGKPTVKIPKGRLVCVGDSITAGALATRPERCYVSRLQWLASKAHSGLQVVNEGLSGFSTGAYAYRADEKAQHIPTDTTLITIMLGTNDTRDKGSPDTIAANAAGNLERLIKAYQARVPNAKIVIITPTALYPAKFTQNLRGAGYDETGPAKLNAIDEAYNALTQKLGLPLIDVSNLPAGEDTPEGVHPNDLGHAKLAEVIWHGLSGQTVTITPKELAEETDRPTLAFERPQVQSRIGVVYADALTNLLDKNTVRPNKSGDQDSLGRMANPPGTFIRAGGGYDQPWTRDASLNSWFAGSLLEPAAARNTLWAVCRRQEDGTVVVQQDNQWWDQCIWVKGAWNHYAVTGDHAFLEAAYPVAKASLAILRRDHYNAAYGLFMGPAFFADGIAGYPPPEYDAANHSSFVLDHPYTHELMALSTNCIYREAYRCAARMARALGRPRAEAADLEAQSDSVKAAINRHLWSPQKQTYAYFIPSTGPDAGKPYFAQEGSGQSFALLFDVADAHQAASVVRQTHIEPKGIVTLWPNLPQFDDAHLGRHNVMLWPLVNGLWASASAKTGAVSLFSDEVGRIADLVLASHHDFYEIYNPRTGQPDGGWQNGDHWGPVSDQTWSATSYIAAIHSGLFGMSFAPDGLHLAPTLPADWGDVELSNLHYRQMTLTIHLSGKGTHVQKAMMDGAKLPNGVVPPGLIGSHRVLFELR
jgi:lysophospholipase L1-like esterase